MSQATWTFCDLFSRETSCPVSSFCCSRDHSSHSKASWLILVTSPWSSGAKCLTNCFILSSVHYVFNYPFFCFFTSSGWDLQVGIESPAFLYLLFLLLALGCSFYSCFTCLLTFTGNFYFICDHMYKTLSWVTTLFQITWSNSTLHCLLNWLMKIDPTIPLKCWLCENHGMVKLGSWLSSYWLFSCLFCS